MGLLAYHICESLFVKDIVVAVTGMYIIQLKNYSTFNTTDIFHFSYAFSTGNTICTFTINKSKNL